MVFPTEPAAAKNNGLKHDAVFIKLGGAGINQQRLLPSLTRVGRFRWPGRARRVAWESRQKRSDLLQGSAWEGYYADVVMIVPACGLFYSRQLRQYALGSRQHLAGALPRSAAIASATRTRRAWQLQTP